MKIYIILLVLSCTQAVDVQLAASLLDVKYDFGLVVPIVHTLQKDPTGKYRNPPANYSEGNMVLGMLRSLTVPGGYTVFVGNSTGNIPFEDTAMCLYRWNTTDFITWEDGSCTVVLPTNGLSDVKSITRDDSTGRLYFIFWHNGAQLYTSDNDGSSWEGPQTTNLGGLKDGDFSAKDDVNLMWTAASGLVDFQIFWQNHVNMPEGWCDNGGNDQRRVIGSAVPTSNPSSPTQWTFYTGKAQDDSLYLPNPTSDPPELQFYRIRPYFEPGTEGARVSAHVLLYAPGPFFPSPYGRQPPMCQGSPHTTCCHGPHMFEAFMSLLSGGTVANLTHWVRPTGSLTKFAPYNAYLFAQGGLVSHPDDKAFPFLQIFLDSSGVFTLPLHRSSGLTAPANGRVTFRELMSSSNLRSALFLNANTAWGPSLPYGCDEGCQTYAQVELRDSKNNVLSGWSLAECDVIMNVDATNILVTWKGGNWALPPPGVQFFVKIGFRAAVIYSVMVADRDQGYLPTW